jgi:hypothetical protein
MGFIIAPRVLRNGVTIGCLEIALLVLYAIQKTSFIDRSGQWNTMENNGKKIHCETFM